MMYTLGKIDLGIKPHNLLAGGVGCGNISCLITLAFVAGTESLS